MVHCRFFWHYHHCSLSFSTKSICLYSSQNLFKSDLQIRSNISTSVSQITKAMEISLSIQKIQRPNFVQHLCFAPCEGHQATDRIERAGPQTWRRGCVMFLPRPGYLHPPGKRSISMIFIISRHGLNAMDLNKEEGQGSWRFVRLKLKTQRLFNLRTWLTLSFSGTS